jgi:hypothetical protein
MQLQLLLFIYEDVKYHAKALSRQTWLCHWNVHSYTHMQIFDSHATVSSYRLPTHQLLQCNWQFFTAVLLSFCCPSAEFSILRANCARRTLIGSWLGSSGVDTGD